VVQIFEILENAYDKEISPRVRRIAQANGRKKGNFSDAYGELRPIFLAHLFQLTNLTQAQMFLDLGSGVGNVVIQAALQYGCLSNGCELDQPRHALAGPFRSDVLRRVGRRLATRRRRDWLKATRVKFVNGDIFQNATVQTWIQEADVALCANKKFSAQMNIDLLTRALQMKIGARLVTLEQIMTLSRISDANGAEVDPATMMKEERRRSRPDGASWTNSPIPYFIYTRI